MQVWLRFSLGAALALALATVATAQDKALVDAAKKEGKLVTYGCPADWSGYGEASATVKKLGIEHTDTQMTSMDEINKLDEEKAKPVADVIDIGLQYGPIAVEKGVVQPYKHSKWDSVPAWAKDANGNYSAAYSGAMAFLVNTKKVKKVPTKWKDLLKPEYKGMVGLQDPTEAANGQFAVIAAAFANGGSESNLTPGLKFFAELKKNGNLITALPDKDTLSKGEVGIGLLWDFQGLAWRKDVEGLKVVIPSDGSTWGPYAAVLSKTAPHPSAGKLLIEWMLSDEGQVACAAAGARPIRNVKLPKKVKANLLPDKAYRSVKPITDWKNMEAISKKLGERWRAEVLGQ